LKLHRYDFLWILEMPAMGGNALQLQNLPQSLAWMVQQMR